jgi:hypothetical protein
VRVTGPPHDGPGGPGVGAPARFDEATARAVLTAAAALGGVPVWGGPGRPRLIRLGSNAVFELPGEVVARVTPTTAPDGRPDPSAVAGVRTALDVADWLEAAGFPSARALPRDRLDADQPVAVAGHLVTYWVRIAGPARQAAARGGSTEQLGGLLRRFHRLEPPARLRPAGMDPVGRARSQLTGALPPGPDRDGLLERLDRVAERYAALDFVLPAGHLHGDATVANLVLDRSGRPALIDLDLLRTGPREWDLIRTATYARRLGWHTPAEYERFQAGYGWDVTGWPGFETLADLTELLQVAWLAAARSRRPELAGELAARTATLLTGSSRLGWRRV